MNFDRVADIYDATRGLPEEVSRLVADRIIAATAAGADTRFLELGVGTGRIALPIAARGHRYTGVDISARMMDRLREKARGLDLTLVQGDIAALPFADDSFDAVVVAHVLHLVPEWRAALAEARRVTVPGGYFVLAGNGTDNDDRHGDIRQQWRRFVEEAGYTPRPDNGRDADVVAALTDAGCLISMYRVARWERTFRPIDLLEWMRDRTFSASWEVPDDVLENVHRRLLAWVHERYGDPETQLLSHPEFHVYVTRWPD